MATSPRMKWPYPTEGADPWYEAFSGMVEAQDASTFALNEEKNILLSGGGTISWTLSTGALVWSAAIGLNSAYTGLSESIEAGSVNVSNDGDVGYVRFIPGPTGPLNIVLRVGSSVPPSDLDRAFVLFRRVNGTIIFRNGAVLADGDAAPIIAEGPAATAPTPIYKLRGTTFGSTQTLNFIGPVPTAATSGAGVSSVELQLAADSVEVTTSPYTFSAGYRNFYVNRGSATDFYLPAASALASQYVVIKTLTPNPVTIYPNGIDTIDNAGVYTLIAEYEAVMLHSGTLDAGLTWNWYVVTRASSGGGSSTFTLNTVVSVSVGNLIAVDGGGNAVPADCFAAYPALGVCVNLVGTTVYVQPSGSASVFSGLTAGTTYYLGASGALVSTPLLGSVVAQPVLQAYSAGAGVLLTGSPAVYL